MENSDDLVAEASVLKTDTFCIQFEFKRFLASFFQCWVTQTLCVNVIDCSEDMECYKERDALTHVISRSKHELISELSANATCELHQSNQERLHRLCKLVGMAVQVLNQV